MTVCFMNKHRFGMCEHVCFWCIHICIYIYTWIMLVIVIEITMVLVVSSVGTTYIGMLCVGVFFANKHSGLQEIKFTVCSLVVFSIQACAWPVWLATEVCEVSISGKHAMMNPYCCRKHSYVCSRNEHIRFQCTLCIYIYRWMTKTTKGHTHIHHVCTCMYIVLAYTMPWNWKYMTYYASHHDTWNCDPRNRDGSENRCWTLRMSIVK